MACRLLEPRHHDVAFEWLQEADRRRDVTLLWRIQTPGVAELRPDPRFAALISELGLGDH